MTAKTKLNPLSLAHTHTHIHKITHTTQTVYKSRASLLLSGRDGDTMMSSESSESTAAAAPNSGALWSDVWSAEDIVVQLRLIVGHHFN